MKGATVGDMSTYLLIYVSIHAPNEGSDEPAVTVFDAPPAFQSTLPMKGATLTLAVGQIPCKKFQSTLPMKGATSWSRRFLV